MMCMATPPASTKASLQQRLSAHARQHWAHVAAVRIRFRSNFVYVDAELPEGDMMPLMRLRYGGSANRWGLALYLASQNRYRDQILPTGFTAGTPDEALDCAAGLYLDEPPTNLRA